MKEGNVFAEEQIEAQVPLNLQDAPDLRHGLSFWPIPWRVMTLSELQKRWREGYQLS